MPVDPKLMASLCKQYGAKAGKSVYYAMENSGRGPFAKGKELNAAHVAFVRKHHKRSR
jgi:hypothetical protein